ncbi:MAG: 5-formyltetrahydrofolate cyclo-ligase [Candidatus Omnitrophica bacterium]|nr:5-formyltetrahydrofolate cyclo-ligase [Candidatus Omnitrophota bacterium]
MVAQPWPYGTCFHRIIHRICETGTSSTIKRCQVARAKKEIRKEIKRKLTEQNDTQRLRKSRLIQKKLFQTSEFKKAKYVMFYLAREEEVGTAEMIARAQKIGKKILVPVVSMRKMRMSVSLVKNIQKDLQPGPYGILQPKAKNIRVIDPSRIDLILVPGIAFDRQGNRLGRGKGYYDKFLGSLPDDIPRFGLAYQFQVLKRLPVFSHDVAVTKVIAA